MTREEMNRIKEKRGYSFTQLSAYCGIPIGTLRKVFNGESAHPRQATLDAIEKVLLGKEAQFNGKAYAYETKSTDSLSLRESAPQYMSGNAINIKGTGRYTVADYRALPDEQRVELIDGTFYEMNSPGFLHQEMSAEIFMTIYNFIRENGGRCKVFQAALDVQLDCDDKTMVQPDILVICDPKKYRKFGIYGAPDFVCEILSDSTRKKDLFLKVSKYLEAGVREYWILDPKSEKLIIYNYMSEELVPTIVPLAGKMGLQIYSGQCVVNLDRLAEMIREYDAMEA